jgi:hypothetical protein
VCCAGYYFVARNFFSSKSGGIMITIDGFAAEYIKKRQSSAVIELKFEPAIGGCACSGKNITGGYVPFVLV